MGSPLLFQPGQWSTRGGTQKALTRNDICGLLSLKKEKEEEKEEKEEEEKEEKEEEEESGFFFKI